jgi:hypothetical protein
MCTAIAERHQGRKSATRAGLDISIHTKGVDFVHHLWGSQLVVLIVFSFTLASCAPNAQLVNETATGGTVLYSYAEEQDVLTSLGRQDALRLLGEKCPAGYRISREGEVPRIDQAVDRAWMGQISSNGQVSREKRWAIQFACK